MNWMLFIEYYTLAVFILYVYPDVLLKYVVLYIEECCASYKVPKSISHFNMSIRMEIYVLAVIVSYIVPMFSFLNSFLI